MMRQLLLTILLTVSGHAATYWVATDGNNSNPGTEAQPFLTVLKGLQTAQAGDTVKLKAGVYSEDVVSQRNGATNSNIVVDGQGVAQVHSFFINNSYHILRDVLIKGRTSGFLLTMGRNADFCILSNNVFDGQLTNMNIVTFTGPDAAPFGDAASDNLFITNTFQNAMGGLVLGMFGDRNRVELNTFKNADAVDWLRLFGRSNYIAFNTFTNVYESGSVGNHPDFIQVFGTQGFGSMGHIIERNKVIHMEDASQLCMLSADNQPIRDWTFRNNLFIGVSAKGTIGINDVKWENNIFYNCSTNPLTAGHILIFITLTNATYTDLATNAAHGARVRNNVFLANGDTRTNVGWYSFTTELTNLIADYNYVAKSNYLTVRQDTMERDIGGPVPWVAGEWWEDNGINGGNPFFVSEPSDFHLQAISVLRNAGVDVDNPLDYDGVAWDTPPSIGALEFASGDDPPCDQLPRAIRAFSIASASQISLYWPANEYRDVIRIDKRIYTNHPSAWMTWTNIYSATNTVEGADSYTDTNVTAGIAYEYQISTLITNYTCTDPSEFPFWDYQYIIAGTEVPLKDARGNLILLVESGVAASLTTELDRLEEDIIGEGYKLFRHDVAAADVTAGATWTNAVAAVRALIATDYATDTNADWSIFIVGHVPIPYSGLSSPGSHTENFGAHPADWYYADMTASAWTDSTVNDTTADYAHNHNVPGDGKFDQSSVPSFPELRIGRIDLRNMPAFGLTEVQLLQRYLDRNHEWRHKQFTVRDRAIINTNGLPFEQWSVATAFFGTDTKNDLGHWLEEATNTTSSYLFASSKGSGNYTDDHQLGTTAEFAATQLYAAFTTMYGSYYGTWDSAMHSNVVLLAPLCMNGYVVSQYYRENVVNWSAGQIGESMGQELFEQASNLSALGAKRYTQYGWLTGGSTFQSIQFPKCYVTLMGDPTLRLRVVAPPTNVVEAVSGSDNVITWEDANDENIVGYHVYRAPSNDLNSFTRLTSTVEADNDYTDTGAASGTWTYMVRAVKLEDSAARSYYHASQGIMAEEGGGPPPPSTPTGVSVVGGGASLGGNATIE